MKIFKEIRVVEPNRPYWYATRRSLDEIDKALPLHQVIDYKGVLYVTMIFPTINAEAKGVYVEVLGAKEVSLYWNFELNQRNLTIFKLVSQSSYMSFDLHDDNPKAKPHTTIDNRTSPQSVENALVSFGHIFDKPEMIQVSRIINNSTATWILLQRGDMRGSPIYSENNPQLEISLTMPVTLLSDYYMQ